MNLETPLFLSGIELCVALILTQISIVGYRCLLLVIISYRCLLLVIITYRQLSEKGRFLYGMVAASRFRQDYGKNSRQPAGNIVPEQGSDTLALIDNKLIPAMEMMKLNDRVRQRLQENVSAGGPQVVIRRLIEIIPVDIIRHIVTFRVSLFACVLCFVFGLFL